jgi:hypothetical protein
MKQFTSTKKGQVWYIDFMVGLMVFVVVVVIYFEYVDNLSSKEENIMDDLIINSKAITNSLVAEGYPKDWNTSNVVKIGLTEGNQRINTTKLNQFISMDYIETKSKLRTSYNYYMFLEYKNGSKIKLNGSDEYGYKSLNPSKLVQTTRLLIYNSTIIRMVVHVWQ